MYYSLPIMAIPFSNIIYFVSLMQVASYGTGRKTGEWELNKAHYRSQWIAKSIAHVQGWLRSESPSSR